MKLRLFDYFFIAVTVIVIAAVSVSAYSGNGKAGSVKIEASGETYLYLLDTDQIIEVPGPMGFTEIVISEHEVFVRDSPCRDKLCVQASPLNKSGEWNACMPNQVFIRITEKEDQELDSLSF